MLASAHSGLRLHSSSVTRRTIIRRTPPQSTLRSASQANHPEDRLNIGLFGLVGMFGVATGPLVGRLIDKLVPWYATLISVAFLLLSQAIQTGAGGINIGAVIIATFGLDVFSQMQQVSLLTAVLA